nr:hypothetical protein [uncultured bacterium]
MFTSVDGIAGNLDNVTYRNRSGSDARTERRQPLRANLAGVLHMKKQAIKTPALTPFGT